MNQLPRDMKVVETIADDDLINEYRRRVLARNGSLVLVETQDVKGSPEHQVPRMRWSGNIFTCIGLHRWAGALLSKTFEGDTSQ